MAGFQLRLPPDLRNRLSADKADVGIVQTFLVSRQAAAAPLLFHQCNRNAHLSQLICQNQSQIAAAQYHRRSFRDKSVEIHHFLHLPGSIDALGSGSGNGQRPHGNLPAAGGQNQLREGKPSSPGQMGNSGSLQGKHGRIPNHRYLRREVLQKLPRIFDSREIAAKSPVGALQKHAAQGWLPVHNGDAGAARPAGRCCRGNSGSASADDQQIIVFHCDILPEWSRWRRRTGFPGRGPCRCLRGV